MGARRRARSTPVKSFSKVGRKAQIGRKTVYEIDPSKDRQSEYQTGHLHTYDIIKSVKQYSQQKRRLKKIVSRYQYELDLTDS